MMNPRTLEARNCRGIGNPHAVQSLCLTLRQQVPDFVFLCKTKLLYEEAESEIGIGF